ncbi:MAG: dockerin type I repeat-containing protein [candidate division Zixibacteria bacterium]|nr:dockerin type I repeat-containing protein [candidate division Zixibacteria bacterium]
MRMNLLVLAVAACFCLCPLGDAGAQTSDSTGHLFIFPEAKIVNIDDTFTLLIAIDTVAFIKNFRIDIEVDTLVIKASSAKADPFFSHPDGQFFFWKDTVYEFAGSGSTYVYEFLGSIFGPGNYVSGPGALVQVNFTAVGHGMSGVVFRWSRLEDVSGEIIALADSLNGLVVVCPTDETFGDADGNGLINIADVVYLINYIFAGGPKPVPIVLVADADCDGMVNIADVVYLLAYIFSGGSPPCNPCEKIEKEQI